MLVCFEGGFEFRKEGARSVYQWEDLYSVFSYKVDLLTTDEVCLDIFMSEGAVIRITESDTGWRDFVSCMSEHLEAVPNDWEDKMWSPAFDTMLTLLYDRKGRPQAEVELECYKH